MVRSISGQLRSPGVDHNGGLSLHGKLFEFGSGHRVRIGGIGAYDHDGICIFKVDDRVGSCTRAKSSLHTQGCR